MPTATPSAQLAHGSIDRILPIDVSVRVIIAECMLPVSTIMEFNVGSILEFAKAADAELQLMVVNQCIGLGHAVKVGENFGLQISSIGLVDDRIHGLVG